ncbi:conserved hypothetical protein [Verticillium alfalfae VaMs.102]|uniref:Uncharacterized protein n=1 Tax=Verticillium alfalfae (strain VaMs.102 / ATCC MYA-4576 / FGSC 10136) TaxID=526221 RepID=C9SXA0_VERA1|nr:conserved hypothetical protein [Verticillium alfalfae VaMs.102]EEY23290.1 conserved hypothetical protein [Verticillium alfalfae VaMs.102]
MPKALLGRRLCNLGGRIRRMNLLHLAPVAHSTRVYIGLAVDSRSRVGGNRGPGSGNLRVWVFGTACRTRVIAFAFVANSQLLHLSTAGRSIYSLVRTISNPVNQGHAGRCRLSICTFDSLPGRLNRLLVGSLHLLQNGTWLFHLIRVHPRQTTHIGNRALPSNNRAHIYRGDFWHDFSQTDQQQLANVRFQRNGQHLQGDSMAQNSSSAHNKSRSHGHGARSVEGTPNEYYSPYHYPSETPAFHARERTTCNDYSTSYDWTQPLTQPADFAADDLGSHEYPDDDLFYSATQSEGVLPNLFDVSDTHRLYQAYNLDQSLGIPLQPSTSCVDVPGSMPSTTAEGLLPAQYGSSGFWMDPSFSTVSSFPHPGGSWGFVKNNTEDEVKMLLSTKFERDAEGKISEFTRNGKVVNLATYLRRKGVTEYDLVDFDTASELPSHIRVRTPSPPPAPGYLRSPDLIRAQEILVINMRKALMHCQQNERSDAHQHGWASLLLWGAGSSHMLFEASKLFERQRNDLAGSLLMHAFRRLEVDLRQLSTQGIKELLFGMSNRHPGMMTALSRYLAAYATRNYERLHPLRLIFTNMYQIRQKHGPAALSSLIWNAMPSVAEEIESAYGSQSPLAVRTWMDLSMLYDHTSTYRMSHLYDQLGHLSHKYVSSTEDDMAFRYVRIQLSAFADHNGSAHRQQLVTTWNYCVANKLVFGIRGQPDVYCYHSVLQIKPWMKRVRQRYGQTLKSTELLLGCKMICCFAEDPHPVEHVDETDTLDAHPLLRLPVSLASLQPSSSTAPAGA